MNASVNIFLILMVAACMVSATPKRIRREAEADKIESVEGSSDNRKNPTDVALEDDNKAKDLTTSRDAPPQIDASTDDDSEGASKPDAGNQVPAVDNDAPVSNAKGSTNGSESSDSPVVTDSDPTADPSVNADAADKETQPAARK